MSTTGHPACDLALVEATPSTPTRSAAAPHSNWILATTILASSLAFVDGSVVNVGLPAIGRDFGGDGAAMAWILSGYLLPLSALLLIGGAAGDKFGRQRLLVVGTALFALASFACAAAPSAAWLLAGRIAQGIGAAMLMPNSLAILGANFSGEERGRAIGIWASVGAAAGAFGPLLGGWLIDAVGWRAIFFINIPVAVAAIVIAMRFLPNEQNEDTAPLDLMGGALASVALAALTWGLITWSAGHEATPPALLALAVGSIALGAFVFVEHMLGARAMLPLGLFRSANFTGLSLLTFLLYGALGGLLVLIPSVLIKVAGYSATAAGAALLPLPLVIASSSSTMGRIAGRLGARLPLIVGPIVTAAGFALTLRLDADGNYWTTAFPALVVIAIGMSFAVAPLTTAVLGSVSPAHAGVASGFNSAVARTGGLVATALSGGVLAAQGDRFEGLFRLSAMAAAAVALAAGVCALVGVHDIAPSKSEANHSA